MKKLSLLFIILMTVTISCAAQKWYPISYKANFTDSTKFAKPFRYLGVLLTPTTAEINILHGSGLSGAQLIYLNTITSDVQSQLNGKQATLVSTQNIKSINGNSLLGAGNLVIGSGGSMVYPGAGIAKADANGWVTSITDNSTNWNTAYTDRLKWDGGATGLTASTGRTSLGASTVGSAFFTLTNPSAITFPRINADNSVSTLSAANFKTALSLTASDVSLGNVTNESKSTMFTSPALTGTPIAPTAGIGTNTTQIATTAFVLANGGGVGTLTIRVDSIVNALKDTTTFTSIAMLKHPVMNIQSGSSYTLHLVDDAALVTMSYGTACTLTVPAYATASFPYGTTTYTIVHVANLGAGTLTITPATSVTIISKGSLTSIATGGGADLVHTGINTWWLIGSLQ